MEIGGWKLGIDMIQISETAARKIQTLMSKQGISDGGLRVGVKGGGCSGLSYTFAWERQPRLGDEVFEEHGAKIVQSVEGDPHDPAFAAQLGEYHTKRLLDDLELLEGAGEGLDMPKVLSGQLSPMFFGSAMNNFGVQNFLERFLEMAPPPPERFVGEEILEPQNPEFSAFIFKIQANMNPAHRDRIAFARICSGRFQKGMEALIVNANKRIKLAQPQQMMASSRETVEEAWPGDIIGLFDPGVFHLGDTLTEGATFTFDGIPMFAPENFARVSSVDTMKR